MNNLKWRKIQTDLRFFAREKLERWLWSREMGGKLSFQRPRVFNIPYQQMGDHWVSFCHFARFRRFSGIGHRLAVPTLPSITADQRVSLLRQIARILQAESELEISNEPAELDLPAHPARHGQTICLSENSLNPREYIAFQFDGISHPQFNPASAELEEFMGCFDPKRLRRVGRPLTLEESMQVLSGSQLFIGVSSGMSHLAASARTPALIYWKGGLNQPDLEIVDKYGRHWNNLDIYKHLRRWNPYPRTRFFSDIHELKQILSRMPLCRVSGSSPAF